MKRIQQVLARKGFLSGCCFIQNATEGKNVCALIDVFGFSLRLFGRHVTGRAANDAGYRMVGRSDFTREV